MKTIQVLSLLTMLLAMPAHANEVKTFDHQAQTVGVNALQPANTEFHSYNFGRVWVNSMQRITYNVQNTGSVPLTISQATISGIYYDAYHNCTALNTGDRCAVEIRYWPMFTGFHHGRFYMSFSEGAELVIDLYGEAYQP